MKTTDVIRKPLITEKTTVIRDDGRTLVFQVAMGANKIDIKRAVELLFGSKVEPRTDTWELPRERLVRKSVASG